MTEPCPWKQDRRRRFRSRSTASARPEPPTEPDPLPGPVTNGHELYLARVAAFDAVGEREVGVAADSVEHVDQYAASVRFVASRTCPRHRRPDPGRVLDLLIGVIDYPPSIGLHELRDELLLDWGWRQSEGLV